MSAAVVYVVDDDPSVRKSLSRLLKLAGYRGETFGTAEEFLALMPRDTSACPVFGCPSPQACRVTSHADAGCLVVDIKMPGISGLELQESIRRLGCLLPVVLITGHGDIAMGVNAMKSGAVDFLPKPFTDEQLLGAIALALEKYRAGAAAGRELSLLKARLATLTPREYEVLQHIISGQLNKQVAADLGTVEQTIKVHRARVMEKLQAASFADLVRMAERAGIPVPLPPG